MFWCPSKPNLLSQTAMDKISKVIFLNKIILRFLLYVMMLQTETYTDMTNEWRDRGFESLRRKNCGAVVTHSILYCFGQITGTENNLQAYKNLLLLFYLQLLHIYICFGVPANPTCSLKQIWIK